MSKTELDDAYKKLESQRVLHKRATRFGNSAGKLGLLILLFSVVLIIPGLLQLFGIPFLYTLAGGVLLGLLLIVIGGRSYRKNTVLAPSLSFTEEAFLAVFEALKKLDTYLTTEDGIEFARVEAAKSISRVGKTLREPSDGYLWMALTKDLNDQLRLLKQNIEAKMVPIVTKGKKEDLEKVYPAIENLAQYLLNPTTQSLKDLNDSTPQLIPRFEDRVPRISLLWNFQYQGHPILQYATIEFVFGFIAFLAYLIGTTYQILSKEQAYYLAWICWITLTAAYMGYIAMAKKRG